MKMQFLMLLTIVSITSALPEPFDFIEDLIFKYVTNETDPCENFYRHVCPLGSPNDIVDFVFNDIVKELKASETFPAYKYEFWYDWNEFYDVFHNMRNISDLVKVLIPAFRTVCSMDIGSSDSYMMTFLYDFNRQTVSGWRSTCEEMANNYEDFFNSHDAIIVSEQHIFDMKKYGQRFDALRNGANVARALIDANLQEGILETEKLGVDLLKIAEDLLLKTPWAETHNVTEKIANYTSKVHLYTNLESELIERQGLLASINKTYSECRIRFGDSSDSRFFCVVMTMFAKQLREDDVRFFYYDNAMNIHPLIVFGFPSYYHAQYAREYASKVGFVGWTFGHEIAHSFINDHYDPQGIGFFSKNAQDCIQNQYDKTCKYYKEKDCMTTDKMLDDNGADIFGTQLSYLLFEKYYGKDTQTIIPRLGISNEQLFFYAFAFTFCSGEENDIGRWLEDGEVIIGGHASRNVRVNAVAQHPGFKKAFNCPDDSKMMQSATEQCIVYGEGAPETMKKI